MQNVLKQMSRDCGCLSKPAHHTMRGTVSWVADAARAWLAPTPFPFRESCPTSACRLPPHFADTCCDLRSSWRSPWEPHHHGRKKLVVNTPPRWFTVSQNSQRTTLQLPGGDTLVNTASRAPSQQLYSLATQTGPSRFLSRSLLQVSWAMNTPSC